MNKENLGLTISVAALMGFMGWIIWKYLEFYGMGKL